LRIYRKDEEIVREARADGPKGFGPIVERYQHAVFGVALSRLGNLSDAEDTAQQVFIEAYQRLDQLKDPTRLGAWLRSITVHRCIDLLRQRKGVLPLDWAENLADPDPTPLETMEKAELRTRVMSAIAGLPRKQRETVTLFYINGYSIKDIAAMQEAPIGSIKRRLHDARGRLKEEMMDMVADTLKAEGPREDFAKQVFEILCLHGRPKAKWPKWPWPGIESKLKELGVEGIEGFSRAMQLPHSPTRQFTAKMLRSVYDSTDPADSRRERLLEMLKQGLRDRNKGVRGMCAISVLDLTMDEKRKIGEILPSVVAMLRDPAKGVRARVAYELQSYARHIPLGPAALALADETDSRVRWSMAVLVRIVAAVGNVPDELGQVPQFVIWRRESTGKGRSAEVPYRPKPNALIRADPEDPSTGGTIDEALAAMKSHGSHGIGMILSRDDPYVGVAMDNCVDPATREILPWASDLVRFLNSYSEISPSGTGIRILVRAKLPPGSRLSGDLRIFDDKRLLAITGSHIDHTPTGIHERQATVDSIHKRLFPPGAQV